MIFFAWVSLKTFQFTYKFYEFFAEILQYVLIVAKYLECLLAGSCVTLPHPLPMFDLWVVKPHYVIPHLKRLFPKSFNGTVEIHRLGQVVLDWTTAVPGKADTSSLSASPAKALVQSKTILGPIYEFLRYRYFFSAIVFVWPQMSDGVRHYKSSSNRTSALIEQLPATDDSLWWEFFVKNFKSNATITPFTLGPHYGVLHDLLFFK